MKHTEYEQELIRRRAMMKGYGEGADSEDCPASDQDSGLPSPPLFLAKGGEKIIPLPKTFDGIVKTSDVTAIMEGRKSRRLFDREESLTLEELSYLLWMTQGVKEVAGNAIRVSREDRAFGRFQTRAGNVPLYQSGGGMCIRDCIIIWRKNINWNF